MNPRGRVFRAAQVAAIVLLAFYVYGPVLRGEWIWDDVLDVTGNTRLHDLAGLRDIWFSPGALYDYYPLKYSVQWLQWHLWGMSTLGYHVTNVALHALSALLIWRLLERLGVRAAWLAGALFAVHPIAVESVAWITELKNTLSLAPLLLAFGFFVNFEEHGRRRDLFAAVGCFLASMLCKTSGVMFPFVLLLYAWWRRGRIGRRDVVVSLPFFAVSLALGLVTMWFQFHRAITEGVPLGGLGARVALSGTALTFYAWKCLVPVNLMAIYPRWPVEPAVWWEFLPWPVFAALGVWCWQHRATWGRHALFGLGWFALNLLPFLGFVSISYLRYSWVVDHMAYLPVVGLIGLVAGGVGAIAVRPASTRAVIAAGAGATVCLGLAVIARGHAATFRSARALWADTVARNPDAWFAQNNLGRALLDAGDPAGALPYFQTAVRQHPDFIARTNLGTALYQLGRNDDALREFEAARQLHPNDPKAYYNLALASARAGHTADALAACDAALRLDPNYSDALVRRANLLRAAGRAEDALRDLSHALALSPTDPTALHESAAALVATGRRDDALARYAAALRLAPNEPALHNDYAALLLGAGQTAEAIAQLQAAVALNPNFGDARLNLGLVLLQANRPGEAVPHFEAVLARDANSLRAQYNLGVALASAGRPADAISHYERALALSPGSAPIEANLALALAATGRVPEAREHYAKARGLDPTLPAAPF